MRREQKTEEKAGAMFEFRYSLLFLFSVLFSGKGPTDPRSDAKAVLAGWRADGSLPPRGMDYKGSMTCTGRVIARWFPDVLFMKSRPT